MRAVNLIPAEQRRGAGGVAGRSGGIVYVVVGGLAVVVALGVLYAFAVKKVADRTSQLATVTAQVNATQVQSAALAPYVSVQSLRAAAVGSVVGIAEQRFDWPDAMEQLALALPNDVTMTSLAGTVSAVSASTTPAAVATTPAATTTVPATGSGAAFTMAGCASSQSEVATVLTRLEHVPGVTGVSLQSAVKSSSSPNNGDGIPRKKNLSTGGGCPHVTFGLTLSYGTTYAVPVHTLAPTTGDAQKTSASR